MSHLIGVEAAVAFVVTADQRAKDEGRRAYISGDQDFADALAPGLAERGLALGQDEEDPLLWWVVPVEATSYVDHPSVPDLPAEGS